jgi:hypothetical protein
MTSGAHLRLQLWQPYDDSSAEESPSQYAQRMLQMEATVWELTDEWLKVEELLLPAAEYDTAAPRSRTALPVLGGLAAVAGPEAAAPAGVAAAAAASRTPALRFPAAEVLAGRALMG